MGYDKGYKFKLDSPFLKSNTKLLPCQKEMLRWWHEKKKMNYRELGEMFKVSKAMAFYICNPDKLKENRAKSSYKQKSNIDAVIKCLKRRETISKQSKFKTKQ